PSADSILFAFSGDPFSPPDSDAITLTFGETSPPSQGPYTPPEAGSITLTIPDTAFAPPASDTVILEF
ncbi:hypothetical protein JI667_21785, partial [Bacillus sp. NTK074B]|nr:hypothetical protein [Bacillus sp. NTK074B]